MSISSFNNPKKKGAHKTLLITIGIACLIVSLILFSLAYKNLSTDISDVYFRFTMLSLVIGISILVICVDKKLPDNDSPSFTLSSSGSYSYQPKVSTSQPAYINQELDAARAFYVFLYKISANPNIQKIMDETKGLNKDSISQLVYTIDNRVAILALIDICRCLHRLGYSSDNLDGTCACGFIALCNYLRYPQKINVKRFTLQEINDSLYDAKYHLSFIENSVSCETPDNKDSFILPYTIVSENEEYEIAQQYLTHLYRFASLIAKADGTISVKEGKELENILSQIDDLKNPTRNLADVALKSQDKGTNVAPPGRSKATPKRPTRDEVLASALEKLNGLTGLNTVKKDVQDLINFLDIQTKRKEAGLKTSQISYHCVFVGNPGTGKTTIARIIAEIYKGMGIIKRGHLVETDRSGLVAEYVGQTAIKTNKIIDSALDGVLFIDEAYSLITGSKEDFGLEAIATLLKRMEDDRKRLVVILAGYSKEMEDFINSNPGLQSRFSRYFHFPDYDANELTQIFKAIAEKSEYKCNAEAEEALPEIMEYALSQSDANFGNARYVRNLFENAIKRQAVRLSSVAPITADMLSELTLHDLGFSREEV